MIIKEYTEAEGGGVYFEEEIDGVIVQGVAKDKWEAMGKIADLMYPPEEDQDVE